MDERILLVGFDAAEAAALAGRLPLECVSHESLPRIVVERGRLFVESPRSGRYLRARGSCSTPSSSATSNSSRAWP